MRVAVVTSPFGGVFVELASMLRAAMRRAGADVVDGEGAPLPDAVDVLVLVGSGVEYQALLATVRADRVVLWSLDPMPAPGIGHGELRRGLARGRRLARLRSVGRGARAEVGPGHARGAAMRAARHIGLAVVGGERTSAPERSPFPFERLAWLLGALAAGQVDQVHVSSPASQQVLRTFDVDAGLLPVPYDPAMGTDLGLDRDIDAVFLGVPYAGRGDQLRRLRADLEAAGVGLEVVSGGCFGDARTELLNRSKVSINLHKFPWHLERTRLTLSMACGAAVVTALPVPDPAPFVLGRDLVAAPDHELAATIVSLVRDGDRRAALVSAASRVLHDGPTMTDVAAALLRP